MNKLKVVMDYSDYDGVNDLKVTTKNGDRMTIQVGNTIVDVSAGYKNERAFIDIYPYEENKPYGFVINDDKQSGVAWRDGEKSFLD